jgi:hypothetical protein
MGKRETVKRGVKKANKKIEDALGEHDQLAVRCGDLEVGEDLRSMCRINTDTPAGIVYAMGRMAATYARWANIRAKVDEYVAALRHDYEQWHAEVYVALAEDYPKSTEKAKENMVRMRYSVDYTKWQHRLREAEGAARRLEKVVVRSLEMKARMLQSIGAMLREEHGMSGMDDAVTTSRTGGSLSNL